MEGHWKDEREQQRISGIVRVVEPSEFTKISALSVEEQRTNVIVDFVDPSEKRKTLDNGFRVTLGSPPGQVTVYCRSPAAPSFATAANGLYSPSGTAARNFNLSNLDTATI